MSLFRNAALDVIRCDEPSYLIWKWRPSGSSLGDNKRENAIRWGSTLRVKDGSVAVFVNRQNGAIAQDYILGPFDQTLKTSNLPGIASVIGLPFGGDTPFQAEVYFINLAKVIQLPFGVPYFDVFDSRFADFGIPVAVRGTITFRITDYKDFVRLHRLDSFSIEDLERQVRSAISRVVKSIVTKMPSNGDFSVFQIEKETDELSSACERVLPPELEKSFGITTTRIDVSNIELNRSSQSYQQLKALTQDITTATVQAKAAATVKTIGDKQRIEVENLEDTLRRQREESQYSTHKQTQTNNLAAFQMEQQAAVGIAGAEALGQMGANGASSVSGEGAGNMNVASLAASLAIGGAVGQNLASLMNGQMSSISTQPGPTPPPIPTSQYYIAQGQTPVGPYSIELLGQMRLSGNFTIESLVWKPGMSSWQQAGLVSELSSLFGTSQTPPPLS